MNILEHIVKNKLEEVQLKKQLIPQSELYKSILFERDTQSLKNRLLASPSGIIAEHKRRSPSKSVINQDLNVQDVVVGYQNAGVCGISVLTDSKYFGGSLDDLILARASCELPLLRKEFIIDEYQILEAKAYGADVILLIAAILSKKQISKFSKLAKKIGLEILLEIHNEEELNESMNPTIDMIGVNNRNLKTFEVSLETSTSLSALIPDDFVKVSESGISSVASIKALQSYGYKGFLMGEIFMKTDDPGKMAEQFISELTL